MDRHLRWDEHIQGVVKRIRCLISKFKFFKEIFDEQHLRVLYYALVQSHLTYGILAWGGVTNNYLTRLETTQRWLIKVMYGRPYLYSTDDLYKESGLFDIRGLFCKELALAQFKKRSNSPKVAHEYLTRNKEDKFTVPRICKTIGQRCHSFLGPRFYNALPANIRSINSFTLFKKYVLKFVSDQPRERLKQLIDLKNS